MKKSIFLSALALVTSMALTGCKDDTQPRLEAPVEGSFTLYEPANNNFTYDMSQNSNTLTLTTSGQPDYGVATPTYYQVQMSLDNTWKDAVTDAQGSIIEPATYASLSTVNTQSVVTVLATEFNIAMTTLQGITEESQLDQYDSSPRPVYFRIRAYVSDPAAINGYVPYSQIFSNSIKINSIQPSYKATLPIPAVLYVIGKYQGWSENGNEQTVTVSEEENGIGSDIYTGYVEMSAEDASEGFRFFTQLGSWDKKYNIGAADPDMSTETVTMEDNVYKGPLVIGGQSNWGISNYPGGWMKLTVDLNNNTVEFEYLPDYKP